MVLAIVPACLVSSQASTPVSKAAYFGRLVLHPSKVLTASAAQKATIALEHATYSHLPDRYVTPILRFTKSDC